MPRQPRWVGDDLYWLLTLPVAELKEKYPTIKESTLKGKKGYWKKKLKLGEIKMPPRPEQSPEIQPTRSWESAAFNHQTGEWSHTTLHAYDHQIDPNEFLQPTARIVVNPTKRKARVAKDLSALIYTDIQAWQGRTDEGELYNFHDTTAIDIVNAIAKEEQPKTVVLVGDLIDFPSLSKFRQEKAFEDTLNPSLKELQRLLGGIRANNPDARIVLLEGNHEKRRR